MSNWQDFALVFYALALAVLGNALVWAVSSAFVRLLERATRESPDAGAPGPTAANPPASAAPLAKRLATGLSR